MALSERDALIRDLERRHVASRFPRSQLTLIVTGAGVAGFLTSVGLLRAGVDAMAIRYPLAAMSGYLAFLALLQCWIHLHRWEWVPDLDVWSGTGDTRGGDATAQMLAGGGRSGGAGGGARWSGDVRAVADARGSARVGSGPSGWSFDLDADDAVWLVVVAVLVCGGLIAVGYVIAIAPALLAEVTLDAALVTTVYRRLRPHDLQHWSVGVVRRTWLPAVVVVLCLAGAGYALQRVAPDARSIGGVIAELGS
jgi:hypothetical protein